VRSLLPDVDALGVGRSKMQQFGVGQIVIEHDISAGGPITASDLATAVGSYAW
jgi:hypothetical protein